MAQLTNFTPIVFLVLGVGGSLHCLSMCGPLVMAFTKNKKENAYYQIGRLMGYLSLGILIKGAGSLFFSQNQKTFALIAGILLGVVFIIQGLSFLNIIRKKSITIPQVVTTWIQKRIHSSKNPLLIGYFSAYLPCGLLYTTLFSLIAIADFKLAVVSLIAFWIGTVPALLATGMIREKLNLWLSKIPKISGTILILAGIVTLVVRIEPLFYTTNNTYQCHHPK